MSLLYLTREEVARLLPDVPAQLDLVEETYRAVGSGRVELPPKPGIHPRPDSFIHAMRDAEVTEAVTQKNCATTQMKSSASAQS